MFIRIIDLESTGFEPPEHAVCEIGWCDVHADVADPTTGLLQWRVTGGGNELVNPGRPIPPETSAIHHIVDEDVADAPTWEVAAAAILRPSPVAPIAFAAHSAKMERQWCTDDLTGGVPWICTYKAALRLWRDAPAHSNQTLRYWRRPTGLDRAEAAVSHRAYPDAYVTAFHLRDLLTLAPLDDLIRWTNEPALQVRCHIGKWRGHLWSEVDLGFLEWIAVRDFDDDVLFTARHEIARRAAEAGTYDDEEVF